MSDEDGLTRRKRTKKVRWDERGRTLTWDGEEAREEAKAQAAREEAQEEAEAQAAREEAREEAEAQAAREARRKVAEAKQRFTGTGANPEFNAHVGSSFGPGTYSIDGTTFTIELNKLPAGRLAAKPAQADTQLQQERQRLLGLLDQNTASLKGLDLV